MMATTFNDTNIDYNEINIERYKRLYPQSEIDIKDLDGRIDYLNKNFGYLLSEGDHKIIDKEEHSEDKLKYTEKFIIEYFEQPIN
jgi:hypothetical protein|tara:strand:+ start:604 stop:858 length:255 start_codon:yes stop_codon:yes gene_type:complete